MISFYMGKSSSQQSGLPVNLGIILIHQRPANVMTDKGTNYMYTAKVNMQQGEEFCTQKETKNINKKE